MTTHTADVSPHLPDLSPYLIDRYVVDTLLRDLVGHDHRPSAFLVYLTILTAASGRKVALSHAQLAERTRLSRRAVQSAIALLQRRELIEVIKRNTTDISEYRPLQPWHKHRRR